MLRIHLLIATLLIAAVLAAGFLCSPAQAKVIEKVVAYIGNEAITMSELEAEYSRALEAKPDITEREVLETMINKRLLLREARKLMFEAPDTETLLKEYIDLKVKAFIKVDEAEILKFYEENKQELGNVQLQDVRSRIEQYLIETEVNRRLREHIAALREKSDIRVLLDEEDQ